jgi:hypothetical protein
MTVGSPPPAARATDGHGPGGRPVAKVAGAGRDGRVVPDPAAGSRFAPSPRRRRVPHLVAGALLVVVCALAFYVGDLRASGRVGVLALARDVSTGQVLTASDLRIVQVSTDSSVSTVAASAASTVIGGTVAAPRPANALLSPQDIGPVAFPPAGKAVVAVALKPGQFPPGLAAGVRVLVLVTASTSTQAATSTGGSPGSGAGTGAADSASGTPRASPSATLDGAVLSVSGPEATSSDGSSVVALLMAQNDATVVGAQSGAVSLLQMPPTSSGAG